MRLIEMSKRARFARTCALKLAGEQLKRIKSPKHIRRRVLLELDLEIIFRILEAEDIEWKDL